MAMLANCLAEGVRGPNSSSSSSSSISAIGGAELDDYWSVLASPNLAL